MKNCPICKTKKKIYINIHKKNALKNKNLIKVVIKHNEQNFYSYEVNMRV